MRGTDGANTVAPDNEEIGLIYSSLGTLSTNVGDIKTATLDLQDNQSDWVTADVSGLSSSTEITALDVKVEQVKTNQEVINTGVQEASLLIPHITNLP